MKTRRFSHYHRARFMCNACPARPGCTKEAGDCGRADTAIYAYNRRAYSTLLDSIVPDYIHPTETAEPKAATATSTEAHALAEATTTRRSARRRPRQNRLVNDELQGEQPESPFVLFAGGIGLFAMYFLFIWLISWSINP